MIFRNIHLFFFAEPCLFLSSFLRLRSSMPVVLLRFSTSKMYSNNFTSLQALKPQSSKMAEAVY